MEPITHNPYRILGVYGGAGITTITGNLSRMRAYLNVGKNCDMPTDAAKLLPAVPRTLAFIEEAFAKINLPVDKVRHALFWFADGSPLDVAALENLQVGNVEKALDIWEKRDTFSTLLNRAIVAFISKRHKIAIQYQLTLIHTTEYRQKFLTHIAGEGYRITEKELSQLLVDTLWTCVRPEDILSVSKETPDYQVTYEYIREKLCRKYVDEIEHALAKSIAVKRTQGKQRYQAGVTLMHDTRTSLNALHKLLGKSDVKYQMIADKLAIEILQCGIDYYNDSSDTDSIDKSLVLQKYAMRTAVGKQTKDRCQYNGDILLKNKMAKEVEQEIQFIDDQIEAYKDKSASMTSVGQFVKICHPYLQRLEEIAGSGHTIVIDYSGAVANIAIRMIIDAINKM
ncbi:MAG: hypothetical protein LUE98_19375 [Tannerellaceae bacterium]|nr:hypothetical protein [Tannerellaceae bacterium]